MTIMKIGGKWFQIDEDTVEGPFDQITEAPIVQEALRVQEEDLALEHKEELSRYDPGSAED